MTGGIGAVGGLGTMPQLPAMSGAAAPISTTMAGTPASTSGGSPDVSLQNSLSQLNGMRLQQLLDLIHGFSSAEILMALMFAAAAGKKKEDDEGCGGLALLAGFALANQMRGQLLLNFDGLGPAIPEVGMSGAALNVQA